MSYVDKIQIGSTAYDVQDTKTQQMIAGVYSTSGTYAVGDYVTYDGKLYRCVTAIDTAEAWTVAHWTEVTVGEDVADLKSDLVSFENGKLLFLYDVIENSYPNTQGGFSYYNNWNRSDYIPVEGGQVIYIINPSNTVDNAWYNSSKEIISRFTIPSGSPASVTVPQNAAFMVVSNGVNTFFGEIYTLQDYYATKGDVSDVYDYQNHVIINETINGTQSKSVSVSLAQGDYIIKIGSVDSTDTDYDTSALRFADASDNFVKEMYIDRINGYSGVLSFNVPVVKIYFYAAHTYNDSQGKTFSFNDFLLTDKTELENRFEKLTDEINNRLIKKTINPYHDVIFVDDQQIKTTTHVHCGQQAVLDKLTAKNIGAIAISNYYPSAPKYTLAETGLTPPTPPIVEIPNAEQHGFTNTVGACHINSIGSMFSSGKPVGETPVGVNDTWQNAIIKIKRQFLYDDGGGISINHPVWSQLSEQLVLDMLDFDPVVLGIEIYNQDCEVEDQKGWALDLWDRILKTGRRCFGFAVPDHYAEYQDGENWNGTVKIFSSEATQEDILRSIRDGAFYCQINHTDLAISNIVVGNDSITITANKSATIKAIIDGEDAKTVTGTTMTVDIPDKAIYARFEIITADDSIYTNPIMYKTRI